MNDHQRSIIEGSAKTHGPSQGADALRSIFNDARLEEEASLGIELLFGAWLYISTAGLGALALPLAHYRRQFSLDLEQIIAEDAGLVVTKELFEIDVYEYQSELPDADVTEGPVRLAQLLALLREERFFAG